MDYIIIVSNDGSRDEPNINGTEAIHWGEDADKFRPERFIDTETYKWPRDACTFNEFFFQWLTLTH
jgi:hypothetical protein